jgi:hypothetical protein
MSKRYSQTSPETQQAALQIAKATQKPGQTKEQTKLIAQGIEKGITLYKKQQKAKARDLNKKRHQVQTQLKSLSHATPTDDEHAVIVVQSKLPWILLILSWIGFAIYYWV